MPTDDGKPERLWELIQSRRQRDPAADGAAKNGKGHDPDFALVNELSEILSSPPAETTGFKSARRRLDAEIRNAPVSPAPVRSARPFWRLTGRRQAAVATALLIVIAAAIAAIVRSAAPAFCPPPAPGSGGAGVQATPLKLPGIKLLPGKGKKQIHPLMGASAIAPLHSGADTAQCNTRSGASVAGLAN